jgi:uncharacterized membrane protein
MVLDYEVPYTRNSPFSAVYFNVHEGKVSEGWSWQITARSLPTRNRL